MTAELSIEYEDINRVRFLGVSKKMIGYEGTGTLTMHKVSSRFVQILTDNITKGKQFYTTIISKIEDPDSTGAERIVLKNVIFENLNLANWETKTAGEDELSFSFESWELMDTISPSTDIQ